ncbi:MAG: winged helix-turn-helix domain-containing protein [Candidatus Baldrarchaeia archaeon]
MNGMNISSLDTLAFILRVLSRVGVLRLLAVLRGKTMSAEDLAEEVGIPISTVRKYLTEMERAGIVEKFRTGNATLYRVREFRIVISPEVVGSVLEREKTRMTADIIKERGIEIVKKLREIGPLVKEGKLSIYDAAEMLGVTYVEAYALLEENGYI